MEGKTQMAQESVVQLKPINAKLMKITIEGTSPLIQHKWSEKALRQMREKGEGKKTKTREPRNPEKEARDATYFTADGKHGLPLLAVKSALIGAAHKDIGIEKTLVRKGLFIKGNDQTMIIPMKCDKPKVREDCVTVGMGSADLRYRPQFDRWSADLHIEYDADLLQPQDIVNLIDRAGFGVGIGEWRPEKGGEMGRFRVRAS
jgi:hypothetical protein